MENNIFCNIFFGINIDFNFFYFFCLRRLELRDGKMLRNCDLRILI